MIARVRNAARYWRQRIALWAAEALIVEANELDERIVEEAEQMRASQEPDFLDELHAERIERLIKDRQTVAERIAVTVTEEFGVHPTWHPHFDIEIIENGIAELRVANDTARVCNEELRRSRDRAVEELGRLLAATSEPAIAGVKQNDYRGARRFHASATEEIARG